MNGLYVLLSDKIAVRDFIAARVGETHLPPCLWVGSDPSAIPFSTLNPPYVIKSAHGCGDTIIVQGDPTVADVKWIQEASRRWLDRCHGSLSDEPAYVNVPRRLIIEHLLRKSDGTPPLEVKAFVFHGRVETLQVIHVDPQTRERLRAHFTREWDRLAWSMMGEAVLEMPLERPAGLGDLIRIAERIGAGLDHVRVDTYICDERIYVGEITLYSQSGLAPFRPDSADFVLGEFWHLRRPWIKAVKTLAAGRRETILNRMKAASVSELQRAQVGTVSER